MSGPFTANEVARWRRPSLARGSLASGRTRTSEGDRMTLTEKTTPDLAAIKQRQQATWASGDYHMIGTQILIVSELMIEALDVHSTERVLDVATGSGNTALAAARRGCAVVGIDYVPALLDRARARAEAEGLVAEF